MIIELIVWTIFVVFIVLMNTLKTKHFSKIPEYVKLTNNYISMKDKPSKSKTMADKMDYVRQKTDTGNDFMSMILSIVMFVAVFTTLIYSRIPNIYVGLGVVLVFSLVFAFIVAKLQFKGLVFEYTVIDRFINYTFITTLMVYLRFVDHIHPILFIIYSIIIMFLFSSPIKKVVYYVK